MIRNFALALTLVAALGFAASQLFARGGGGHGGGHHGGGHHGGHHGSHHSSHHSHHAHHSGHHHAAHYAHHNRPFNHGWYGHHGGAWGGWGWGGWGGAWAPAAWGATAAWLGLNAADGVVGGYAPVDTVYTSDTSGDDDADSTDELPGQETAQDDNDVQPEQFAPATEAAALAKTGAVDPPKDAELLPLGVYSLAPQGQEEASAMLQLSVAKDGVLRGSYYDLLSDQGHPIKGAVDKKTQRVAFTIGDHGKVLFETSLKNLTEEKAPLTVHYENGNSRPWTIARFHKEDGEDKADDGTEEGADEEAVTGTVENDEQPAAN